MAGFEKTRLDENDRFAPSFVAVAAAVELLALQVATGVVDAGDFHAEAVDAPADPPSPTTGRLTLFAFEEAFLVTVRDVQRQSQNSRSVLHALNEIIQPSPAGSELWLQFIQAERCEVQVAALSKSGQLLLAVFGLLHGLGFPAADVVSAVQRHLSLGQEGLWDRKHRAIVGLSIF